MNERLVHLLLNASWSSPMILLQTDAEVEDEDLTLHHQTKVWFTHLEDLLLVSYMLQFFSKVV